MAGVRGLSGASQHSLQVQAWGQASGDAEVARSPGHGRALVVGTGRALMSGGGSGKGLHLRQARASQLEAGSCGDRPVP